MDGPSTGFRVGDRRHVARLKLVLRHFMETHGFGAIKLC